MGMCNSTDKSSDVALQSEDPPVATVEEDSIKKEAPITVDLNEPTVDVSAPLDSRDIELVQQTFARVALLGAEEVGWILFMNIFEIAPGAKQLFPFKDDPDISKSPAMRTHAAKVVNTVATAVSLLKDLDTLVPVLHSLGLRHVGYSVIPEHYDIVGQALIKSLNTALGPSMTPAVTNAYLKVFTIIKSTMLEKCDYEKLAAAAESPAADPEAAQSDAAPVVEAGWPEHEAVKDSAAPEYNAEAATKEDDQDLKAAILDEPAEKNKKVVAGEAANKKAPVKKKQPEHGVKKKKEESGKKKKEEEGAEKKAEGAGGEGPQKVELTVEEKFRAAAENGDDKAVAAMLKAGVDVNCADADGKTALHIAAQKGFADMIGRLTNAKKVKVGAVISSTKDTALHLACQEGHRECAVLIVRGGALFRSGPQQQQQTSKLCNAKNRAGKTPAQASKDTQLGQWLQSANPASTDPPWQKKMTK